MRRTDPARVPPLYAIADRGSLEADPEGDLVRSVAIMAEEGVRWIQIRAKGTAGEVLLDLAVRCREVLEGSGTSLWLDDRADVAAMSEMDGVHVGQEDLPPGAVRRVVGPGLGIGRSTHDPTQLLEAVADPEVDVVAVGPVFPTAGKDRPDPVVGLDLVREAARLTDKPIVAIGGITAERAPAVLAAGADAVAVIGAVCRGDVASNCRRLLEACGAGT